MTELREITKENLEEVLRLTVWEHQQAFVSSVAHSLAQAYVYRNTAFPFAVYADGAVVGFIMLGYYAERDQYTLWKLLIDKKTSKQRIWQGCFAAGDCVFAKRAWSSGNFYGRFAGKSTGKACIPFEGIQGNRIG